ncbi:MAG TPA: glutathione S-transferase family protein [Sandaracinaceae bacterium]
MTILLYGHPYSHNSRKVQWALEELGLDYELRVVDLMTGQQKQSEFLRLNPNGRVPVIHDGELVLYESNAILWYLANKAGALLPKDAAGRALTMQWLAWQVSDLGPACVEPWLAKFYASLGQPFDAAKHREQVERAKHPLSVLDAHLNGRRAVVGQELGVADIAIAESIGLCGFAGIDLAPYAAIRAWYEPLTQRAAFAKTRPQG